MTNGRKLEIRTGYMLEDLKSINSGIKDIKEHTGSASTKYYPDFSFTYEPARKDLLTELVSKPSKFYVECKSDESGTFSQKRWLTSKQATGFIDNGFSSGFLIVENLSLQDVGYTIYYYNSNTKFKYNFDIYKLNFNSEIFTDLMFDILKSESNFLKQSLNHA